MQKYKLHFLIEILNRFVLLKIKTVKIITSASTLGESS